MLSTRRASTPDDGQGALDSVETGTEKFFWITSLNRVVDDPLAIGIARIGRKPIRMRIASRDLEDEQNAPNWDAEGARTTTIRWTIAARTTLDTSRR
jgi:hypothetical protein